MGWQSVLVLLALVGTQALDLPPPFPRPGTTLLLENDVVAIWNVSWLKQKYPLHTHRYDLVGVSFAEGDRIITQGGPGRLVNTKAWAFQTNRANVTHVEEGASDPPMRAVLIELKNAAPREVVGVAAADGLRQVAGAPAFENNRAVAWAIPPGSSAPSHRHVGDAVELIFDGSTTPKAAFVPAGTVHAGPAAAGGRAFIFEIK
jgi:hypothetical protein